MTELKAVSIKQLERYPVYLKHLKSLKEQNVETTSAPQIADALGLNEEQVRKDLQIVTSKNGKPKLGRQVEDLIEDIESFLGYNDVTSAVIVGVGHLGEAFMKYKGFKEFGLNILAGFDVDPNKIGKSINEKPIFDVSKIPNLIPRLNVHIAILTTPNDVAQEMCDILVQAGIKGVWNFVPVHLEENSEVVIENVNLASSLAVLSHKLKKKIN
jgi:redox-sensing transcriptional repressor